MRKWLIFILCLIICIAAGWLQGWAQDKAPMKCDFPVAWIEADSRKTACMAADEAAVLAKPSTRFLEKDIKSLALQFDPKAIITRRNSFVSYIKLDKPIEPTELLEKLQNASRTQVFGIKGYSPVFYMSERRENNRMVLTGEIIVQYRQGTSPFEILHLENLHSLVRLREFSFDPHFFIYAAGTPIESLQIANELLQSEHVVSSYPNWLREMALREVPNDPLFASQWHLHNTGQNGGTPGEDINVINVWDANRGANSVIAIVDDGLDLGHVDLSDNIYPGISYDWVDMDPNPNASAHGTACAGVAAARGFNAQGVSGAAPYSQLVGYRLVGANTDVNEADALTRNSDIIQIYSNSWGPEDGGHILLGPGPLTQAALADAAANGRGGKGVIYVWAGGNGFDTDNSNYDGYANSRYVIAVAASTNYGTRAVYSEKGANLLLNAPSGGGSLGIATVDATGPAGYTPTDYYSSFNGTSAAAPIVSGVVGLILEANPNLSWRDVRGILISTAEKNDPSDPDWTINAAGYLFSHKYGFGRINARAAVDAAAAWTPLGNEIYVTYTLNPNLPIPDNDNTGVSSLINVTENLKVEHAEVIFNADDHTWWPDLEVILTSPSGTQSVLAERHYSLPGAYVYHNWRFGSVRHYGESSYGDWTLRVRDLLGGDTGTFKSWTLKIYGVASLQPVFRFWSNFYGSHHYTVYEQERDFINDNWPDYWTYEGVAFFAYSDPQLRTFPVYRFWSPVYAAHFFTIWEEEKNYVMATWPDVWTYEGIAFYAYPVQEPGTFPVHRFWSPVSGAHFFTIWEEEKNYVMATWPDAWFYEGVAFYAYMNP